MDYQRASGLRRKSLTDLITERMLSSTTTLPTSEGGRPTTTRDYSIGGAITSTISEKMKASATGLREKFDPMNIARALTGGSNLAAALVGRMTGRKTEDIDYFAGRGKKKAKKDPNYTKVGEGANTKLRIGDSYSDVLAKMFLFMRAAQEHDKINYELEKNFREEQIQEDERRHDKLVESILKGRKGKKEKGNTEDFLDKLFNRIKEMASGIYSVIGGLYDRWIKPIWEKIGDLVKKLVIGNLDKVVRTVNLLTALVSKLGVGLTAVAAAIKGVQFMMEQLQFYDKDGNMTWFGETLDKASRFFGGAGIAPDYTKREEKTILESKGNKDSKKRWEQRLFGELGRENVEPAIAEALKIAHNIDVPKEQINTPKDYVYEFSPEGTPSSLGKNRRLGSTEPGSPIKHLSDFTKNTPVGKMQHMSGGDFMPEIQSITEGINKGISELKELSQLALDFTGIPQQIEAVGNDMSGQPVVVTQSASVNGDSKTSYNPAQSLPVRTSEPSVKKTNQESAAAAVR